MSTTPSAIGTFSVKLAWLLASLLVAWQNADPALASPPASSATDLARQFAAPPPESRPWVYWFWLDGNITREGITADLEAMQRVGIGGVLIMEVDQGAPKGPARFGSPVWRELFKHAVVEANRLGIQVNMNNDAGWCGSGGPWITPALAMQKVVWSEKHVKGPGRIQEPLPQPQTIAGYYRDIAVLAFPTPEDDARIKDIQAKAAFVRPRDSKQAPLKANWPALPANVLIPRSRIVDVTTHLDKDGRLTWEVPVGKWTILRLGHTPTGANNLPAPAEGRGLDSDKFNKEATEFHFQSLMAKLIADVGPLAGKTLVSTHIDSWETGWQNWTPRFREEFQKRRGYDPLLLLPVLNGRVVDSLEVSERFLWDLRQTVSDLLVENYAGHMRTLANKHGLRLSIEAYDGCPCDNMTYAGQADEPMAEFWSWNRFGAAYSCTEMTSAAHVYGKPIIGAEAFTAHASEKWLGHPANIRDLADWAFCEGINRMVIHRFAMQPWPDRRPGMSMGPWGLHYERTQTWWEQSRPWHEYLARCQFLLQKGLWVADICYLEPENAPQRFQAPTLRPGTRPGRPDYNFDGCTPEVVLKRLSVKDGRLVLPDGMSYRLLVLPPVETMTPPLLRKVKELVEAGATVVGSRPVKSPSLASYPNCDAEVKRLAEELWGNSDGKTVTEHRYGRGRVVQGKTPSEVLVALGVPPDFSADHPLRYTHRVLGDTDYYFVANPQPREVHTVCTFRVSGKLPELWSPETGRIEPSALWQEKDGCMRVTLRLGPSGSVFVMFRKSAASFDPVVTLTRDGTSLLPSPADKPGVIITKAVYGVLSDPKRTRDVRVRVQDLVDKGEYSFQASLMAEGDDPALNVIKELLLEYTLGGRSLTVTARDPDTVRLIEAVPVEHAADVHLGEDGRLSLDAWQPGRYELKTATGQMHRLKNQAVPQPLDVAGPWEVSFAPGWGAPPRLTLDKLVSWAAHANPGVRYFSGTATYRKTIQVPAKMIGDDKRLVLDLGNVQVIARVKLNGKDLEVLWMPPFRVEITDAVRVGDNALEVEVTNLWPNRMIGDENLPEDSQRHPDGKLKEWPQWLEEGKPSPTGRYTFTTWRRWRKDEPLLESGLLGPVQVRTIARVGIVAPASVSK